MFGGPARIKVQTVDDKKSVVVSVDGRVTAEALQGELEHEFLHHLSGASDWHGVVTVAEGNTDVVVSSELQGMGVALPQPITKLPEEQKQFQLDIGLGGKRKGQIGISYGEQLTTILELSDSGSELLKRGTVHFGGRRPELSARRSLRFTGSQTELDLSSWLAILSQQTGIGEKLPLEVAMERLHLLPFHDVEGEKLRFNRLPAIDFIVNHFSYHDVNLGKLRFKSTVHAEGWQLEELAMEGKGYKLTGSGRWIASPSGGNSSLNVVLTSKDVGKFMKTAGFSSVITEGKGDASGKFSWPGRPNDFSLAQLNGKFSMKIEDGQMIDVDPGAGRLLGLFSLEALPQRLALDFSDMTKEGMAFSEMKGDVEIKKGDAFTKNITMKSNAANILVTGRTGLARRDYDQMVSVSPNVSGTAAVASTLVWGPYVAATLLLMQKVFKGNILGDGMIIQYKVTGSWNKPIIERIGNKGDELANDWE